MIKKFNFRITMVIMAFLFTACSASLPRKSVESESLTPFSTTTVLVTQTAVPGISLIPETPTSSLLPNATLEATATTIEVSPLSENSFLDNCPIQTQSQLPLWLQGSILFDTGRIVNDERTFEIVKQPGIWAASTNSLKPHLVYESVSSVLISPDGNTLLDVEHDEQQFVLYDLLSGRETILEPSDEYLFAELWFGGRIQYDNVIERVEGEGIKQVITIPNSETKSVETIIKEIELPGLAFNDNELDRGNFFGFESIDPTGQRILYTAYKGDGNGYEVRLLNLETGEILWHGDTQFLPDASPQWSEDGSSVVFVINISANSTQYSWWKIVSLTREGEEINLPPQPFPLIDEGQLNHFSRSPDGHYLFYTAFEMDMDNLSGRNRAFIVNVEIGGTSEICDLEADFIAAVPARNDIAGYWLPNNQLVYRVLIRKEGKPTHLLRVLDIPSWTAQTIFEGETNQGVNIIGWTPVEFP